MIREEPYNADARTEILELVGRSRIGNRIWQWQFEANPRGYGFEPVVLRDTESGQIVGFNGVMPVRVRYAGCELDACWSCDFHVRDGWRGSGVGRQVKEALHARHPLLMTFGVSAAAARVLPRMGWRAGDDIAQYRRLTKITTPSDGLRRLMQGLNRFLAILRRIPSMPAGLHTELTCTLPDADAVDALWQRAAPGYDKIVCRDYSYLDWRYQQCPVGRYRFIQVLDEDGLRALAVYRQHRTHARLVDMVAEAGDIEARRAIVSAWLDATATARSFSLVTSDRELGRVARSFGFFVGRGSPGFFVRCHDGDAQAERGWFIMSGDSDGEFLQAAANEAESDSHPVAYSLTPDECFGHPELWERLRERSRGDPLFLGTAWQAAWWRTWHRRLRLRPMLIGVYRGNDLIALAPFYRYRRRSLLGLAFEELHQIGNAPGIAPTVRTEYTDVLIDPEDSDAALATLDEALSRIHWDELIISDYVAPGWLARLALHRRLRPMTARTDIGVHIPTDGSFHDWLSSLGHNTRLKAYNRRRYLAERGIGITRRTITDPDEGFRLLNAFHRQRWGKPAFADTSLAFHQRLRERLGAGASAYFDVLELDGEVRSVLYDVRCGDRIYNLQAGFCEAFDPKVSLGTLHLGYAIEAAFDDPAIKAYDLLAGGGKHSQYKRHFRGHEHRFESYHLTRSPLLKALYSGYYALPEGLRTRLQRWRRRYHHPPSPASRRAPW